MDGPEASSSNDFTDHTQSSPFFGYTCWRWDNHAREVDYESKLTDLIVFILKAELGLKKFFLVTAPFEDRKSPDIPPLYLAAALGLYWPCNKLAQSGTDGNEKKGYWGTALHVASARGNENIVRLLLDHGANINLKSERCDTALHVALTSNDEDSSIFTPPWSRCQCTRGNS